MALKGFMTAQEIVDEALLAVGDTERKRLGDAVRNFIRGYRDFNLYSNEAITEQWLPVTAIKSINLPQGFMRFLWIGVSINGELFSFTKSNKIVPPVSSPLDEHFDLDRGEDEGISRYPVEGYGAKAINMEYYYNLDLERRRIVLKQPAIDIIAQSDRTEVLLGYVSVGVENLDNTYIYGDAANMLIAYVEWKLMEERATKVPAYVIEMKKQNYLEAKSMYDCLNMPSIDELYDSIYEAAGQNVRI